MKYSRKVLLSTMLLSPVLAQESICDKYTTGLLKNNTASNQYTLLTLLVNTALIGNYTSNATAVTGILVPGQYNNKTVTLLPYFNGGLLSSNRDNKGTAVNFLDDGGAIPLAMNKPANGVTSNQYRLVTHLYQYFGILLGCSKVGQDGFANYQGSTRMYELHKFMNLNPDEMGYFIQEVALSAQSFGVAAADIAVVGTALTNMFNRRCAPKVALPSTAKPDYQAICINSACPTVTASATCAGYNKNGGIGTDPATASSTIGPQLSDLAPQLSSIQAGKVGAMATGPISYTTSVYTTLPSGASSSVAMTTVVPIGGAVVETITSTASGASGATTTYTTTIPSSVIDQIVSTISTNSSSIETTIMTTEANTALNSVISGSVTSVQTVETSVIVSGSSTITSLITTSVASTLPVSTSTRAGAAPVQTAAMGVMAVVGAAGLIGQML